MNDKLEEEIRAQLHRQYQRGMYTAAYGLSGAINEMIAAFRGKRNKRLADYEKLLFQISTLCQTKLQQPDKSLMEEQA